MAFYVPRFRKTDDEGDTAIATSGKANSSGFYTPNFSKFKPTDEEIDATLQKQAAERVVQEKKPNNVLESIGEVGKGVAKTVGEGIQGAGEFAVETAKGVKNFLEIKDQQDKEGKYQEGERAINSKYRQEAEEKVFRGYESAKSVNELSPERQKAWENIEARRKAEIASLSKTSERGDSKKTNELFKEQSRNAEAFDKAGQKAYRLGQYIPGVSMGVEGAGTLAAAIEGDDSDVNKRLIKLTQDKDWDKLTDEEKKQALTQRNISGALTTLDVIPLFGKVVGAGVKGAVKGGVKEGATAASKAYGESIASKTIKDVAGVGVKELAKQSAKSTAIGTVAGAGLGVGLNAVMDGDNWQNAAIEGATSGAIGGFLGSPLDVSTGKAAIKARSETYVPSDKRVSKQDAKAKLIESGYKSDEADAILADALPEKGLSMPGSPKKIGINDASVKQAAADFDASTSKTDAITAKTDMLVSHEGAPDVGRVNEYKQKIRNGEPIEPIKVIREGEKYGIEDGKHRFEAYKQLGIEDVPVELVEAPVSKIKNDPIEPLKQEALKYKTVDEFVEAKTFAKDSKVPIADQVSFEKTLKPNEIAVYKRLKDIEHKKIALDREAGYKPYKVSKEDTQFYDKYASEYGKKYQTYFEQADKAKQQLTDLYNQAHTQPTPKVEAPQATKIPMSSVTPPKTERIVKTKDLKATIDDIIYRDKPELLTGNDMVSDIALGEGGITNIPRIHTEDLKKYFGNTENIPSRYKRTTGEQDLDLLAQRAGYDDVDTYVEAIQQTLETRKSARENVKMLAEMRRDPDIIAEAKRMLDEQNFAIQEYEKGNKISGNALRIQENAVKGKLTQKMSDLPTYRAINMEDQARMAVELVNADRQLAIDIIDGKINPVGSLKAQSVHQALEEVAMREADGELLTKLAKSSINTELSESAQKLRIAAERDPNSPVEMIRQLRETRRQEATKRGAKVSDTEKADMKAIKQATPKIPKENWDSFIKGLEC